MTLSEFLTARLDEDEAAALESKNAPAGATRFVDADQWSEPLMWLTGEDRMLREVAAKRAIIPLADVAGQFELGFGDEPRALTVGDQILRALAAIYSDHPDYRQEWAPVS
jgi:hypothetical protein